MSLIPVHISVFLFSYSFPELNILFLSFFPPMPDETSQLIPEYKPKGRIAMDRLSLGREQPRAREGSFMCLHSAHSANKTNLVFFMLYFISLSMKSISLKETKN